MNQESQKKILIDLFIQLKNLLADEDTSEIYNVISGIDTCLELLNRENPADVFTEVKEIHKSFYPQHGGLADYFIWRDDFDEREKLNFDLEKIKKTLWDLMEN